MKPNMKIKRVIYILSVAYAMIGLDSCETLNDVMPESIKLADAGNTELMFSGEEESRTIEIVAVVPWTAESDQTWCMVSPTGGSEEDTKLTITVSKNKKLSERKAVVTLTAGSSSLVINVTQAEKSFLSVDEADFIIESDGDTFEVILEHNVEYEVKIPRSVRWIKEVESKAVTETRHEFEVAANEDDENRSAVITFVSLDGEYEEEVEVVQLRKDALVISDRRYEVEETSGVLEFTVISSQTLNVRILDAPWLTMVESKSVETQLAFVYAENDTGVERTARIKLTSGTATDYIEVVQKAKADNMCFIICHENQAFEVPTFAPGFYGTISWGDGIEEDFETAVSHEYTDSQSEHNVYFDLYGPAKNLEFTLNDLNGITRINLEKLR